MKTRSFLLAAGVLLAMAFTFSCSGDGDGENKPPEQGSRNLLCEISDSYGYNCAEITEAKKELCFEYGGQIVNSCRPPNPSSSGTNPSSSSNGGGGSNCPADFGSITIGSQIWAKKNLNCDVAGSKCYDNDPANCAKYGRLYDWSTAKTACPNGWHLPSYDEWTVLKDFVGSNAGTKLKATDGWNSNGNGTDEFGFSALPGGGGISNTFFHVGNNGIWWSASEYESEYESYSRNAYSYFMSYDGEYAYWYDYNKGTLFSVRCLQD